MALAPALRRLPALRTLTLSENPFGDEGLAALVAPPPPAGALPPPSRGLTKLVTLDLSFTQITDASCAVLVAAIENRSLDVVDEIKMYDRHLDSTIGTVSAAGIASVSSAMRETAVRRYAEANWPKQWLDLCF